MSTTFPSVHNEGNLLGPEVLDQLLAADLPGQKSADFGLEARRNLTDEVAALFADARALWGVFQNRRARLRPDDIATTVTRDAWVIPFLGLLGYELRYNQKAYEVDGLSFAISHRAGDAEDAPPVHIVGTGQPLGRVPASGRPRLAPHSLVQEYLNRTDHVWGLVTNGLTLRLLRDSTFIRRQAYVEFDLQLLLEGQHFQDFEALYRLLHRTRLARGLDDSGDALLEKYREHSEEQGGRVRERLRDGVEECLQLLANGFLRHPANEELRQRVSRSCTGNERITPEDLYRQLLCLVYRFLFLLVSEDRGLLSSNLLFREHYAVGRLRRLDPRTASPDHDDLWHSLRVLWRALADEHFARFLEVAPLNGELFNAQDLDHVTISNRDLLEAFWHLAWYQEGRSGPRRVNYAALDVEELGSVYESLLEFHPAIEKDTAGRPFFQLIPGTERKTTGSFYTPPHLVSELVRSALEPVLADRLSARPTNQEKAILSIRICDPACGSGHFLLAAARRLGKELARIRSGDEEPPPEQMRDSVRDVISHCIYGVDKNPLAVDLCRVALWLESNTIGKPLTFLDHRIRLGDSLVGVFDLGTLAEGIPDEAFKPFEGDDKTTARMLAKRNREERGGQMTLGLEEWSPDATLVGFIRNSHAVDSISDDSPEAIRRKKQLFERSHDDPIWLRQKVACDLWTAAYFQPLNLGVPAITSGTLLDHLHGRPIDPRLEANAEALSLQQNFFHWKLEFPEVFAEGGFDVVLSNPPWEQVELNEQEFFSTLNAQVANAQTKADRSRLITSLREGNPDLHAKYSAALRSFNAIRDFLAQSGRFTLTGYGRINTYSVFAELGRALISHTGRSGIVIPSGIAFADTTKAFFGDLIQKGHIVSLFSFFEIRQAFPGTDSRDPFCLFTLRGSSQDIHDAPEFVFNARNPGDLRDHEKRFILSLNDINLLSPNTKTCPIFHSHRDAELTKAIYRRVPILMKETLGENDENHWDIRFSQGLFNMASGSEHFQLADALTQQGYRLQDNIFLGSRDRYLPLYEAKMLHQFDHRWSTYLDANTSREVTTEEKSNPIFTNQPRYWVREQLVDSAIQKLAHPVHYDWLLGWRDICRSTDERTTISAALPRYAVGDTFLLFFIQRHSPSLGLTLTANLNSFIQDYCARQKVGGTHLKYHIFKQLPIIPPTYYESSARWDDRVSLATWIFIRALELTCTTHDLALLARACGYSGPPFRWDRSRRFEIRCELDAAFFHMYIPSDEGGRWIQAGGETPEQLHELMHHFPTPREAVAFILDQFPIVRQKDEKAHGHYRTKDRILEIYDAMLEAQRTGKPYQTTLNPPPGVQS